MSGKQPQPYSWGGEPSAEWGLRKRWRRVHDVCTGRTRELLKARSDAPTRDTLISVVEVESIAPSPFLRGVLPLILILKLIDRCRPNRGARWT